MPLSQEQWFKKIKNLVPTWVANDDGVVAILKSVSLAMSKQQEKLELKVSDTFIDTAQKEYVDLHAEERSVSEINGEGLSSYRNRVKKIVNKSNKEALKMIGDGLLIRCESTIIENYQVSNHLNRGSFLNRNIIDYETLYNAFTILIDYQVPEPTSFYNMCSFLDREFLQGSKSSSDSVFQNVIDAVNENKAYGVVYRLIERANN